MKLFKHVAGIIPVAGQPMKFNFPWPDCMQPLNDDYLAIENAVVACAHAGCRTIWIVCNDDIEPLLRHRLGSFVLDPTLAEAVSTVNVPKAMWNQIYLFYVPIHPSDRNKRDSLGWSGIYGAHIAKEITSTVSQWTIPTSFFVCFPYGVFQPNEIRVFREQIRTCDRLLFSFEGKTVVDDLHLPFVISWEDVEKFRKNVIENGTGKFYNVPITAEGKRLRRDMPVAEQYSARYFSLGQVFAFEDVVASERAELSWFYDARDFESLTEYWRSERRVSRPPDTRLQFRSLRPFPPSRFLDAPEENLSESLDSEEDES